MLLLYQRCSPASPSPSTALELLSPIPAISWQFLQHFPLSGTAPHLLEWKHLTLQNILGHHLLHCTHNIGWWAIIQDDGLRESFLGHWNEFSALTGSDVINTWIRTVLRIFITHACTHACPMSTEMFPPFLTRNSRLFHCRDLSYTSWKKREGGHTQGPGKEGMPDANAQVSSEDDVTCADCSVYQHH